MMNVICLGIMLGLGIINVLILSGVIHVLIVGVILGLGLINVLILSGVIHVLIVNVILVRQLIVPLINVVRKILIAGGLLGYVVAGVRFRFAGCTLCTL